MVILDINHQKECFKGPIASSVVFGGIFTALSASRGSPTPIPHMFVNHAGFIYLYNAMQCPMEAIHGRRSAIHNFFSGGIMGYIVVSQGHGGIPFVNESLFYRHPSLRPPMVAFGVYGAIGGAIAMVTGKPI